MKNIIFRLDDSAFRNRCLTRACLGQAQTEVGGQYKIMADTGNFGWHQTVIGENEKPPAFTNQRFRANLNPTFDERVRAYVQVQFSSGPRGGGGAEVMEPVLAAV